MNNDGFFHEQLKVIRILAITMIVGILLFSGFALWINSRQGPFLSVDAQTSNLVFGIALVVAMLCIYGARYLYSTRVSRLKDENEDWKIKLDRYRSIFLLHHALCEFPALAGVVCFLLLGNLLFFLVTAMALLEMIRKFPSRGSMDDLMNKAF